MSLWTVFDGGCSRPVCNHWRERLLYRIGHWLANRHQRVHIGEGCLIHPGAKVCPRQGEIHIGDHTIIAEGTCIQGKVWIGSNCSVQRNGNLVGYAATGAEEGTITIGDDTRIAANCMMIATNHNFSDPDELIRLQGSTPGSIQIGSDVWLGGYVKITAGTTVGNGAVLGMGSVVTRDIPAYAVAVGVPAKVIRSRKDTDDNH